MKIYKPPRIHQFLPDKAKKIPKPSRFYYIRIKFGTNILNKFKSNNMSKIFTAKRLMNKEVW